MSVKEFIANFFGFFLNVGVFYLAFFLEIVAKPEKGKKK
jgi:hypothetical protein